MLRSPAAGEPQVVAPAPRADNPDRRVNPSAWITALQSHRLLVTAALLLTMAALLVTLWSPLLPAAPR
jgi:hypothetical protein